MPIPKVSSRDATPDADGEIALAAGKGIAMRMWKDEPPQDKAPHRSPYETVGFVLAGRAELTVSGETIELAPGDSWAVPAGATHTYKILETFTAVEATSPPASTA